MLLHLVEREIKAGGLAVGFKLELGEDLSLEDL
jgi:hypothetical protein